MPAKTKRQSAPLRRHKSFQQALALGGILIAATVIAYLPAIRAGFIWDDPDYVINNSNLRSARGLFDTWFHPTSLPQFYPLVHTTFWIEYHLWGLDPIGYHLVNVLLHINSALLIWLILKRLEVPGAYLAACVFALHPVMVESVAWITERKNVLSCVLYLASAYVFLCKTHFGLIDRPASWRAYSISLVLFLCALFSKTVTATLPAAILLILWWKNGRLRFRDLYPLIPFFLLGIAMGAVTGYLETHHVGATAEQIVELRLSPEQRVLIAGRAIAFYAWKLVWPAHLSFIYPRWNWIDHPTPAQWLFPIGVLTVLATLFALRKQIGRGPVTAALFFCGTLFPALGFVNVYPMRFSFVADHFQYHASIGLIALFAAGVCRWLSQPPWLRRIVRVLILAPLAVLTFRQCLIYKDAETLWRTTSKLNSDSWLVWTGLANALVASDPPRYAEAIPMYFKALVLAPHWHETHWNAGEAYMHLDKIDQAEVEFREALRLNPDYPPAWTSLGKLLFFRRLNVNEAIAIYRRALAISPTYPDANYYLALALEPRDPQEAAAHYRLAVAGKPEWYDARYNLGTCVTNLGEYGEAIFNLREAVRINPNDARAWTNLGVAQLKSGHSADAVNSFQQALRIDPNLQPARAGLNAAMGRR
jgi:tetratricopeptide (TPR) repeat protein